MIIIIM